MQSNFYRAFEERFRGSRSLIKERLKIYLPFIEPFRSVYSDCELLDLGCGRGEWLELMREIGFVAHGVDIDPGMLSACNALGLSVSHEDVMNYIRLQPAESQVVVSGFHVAEHLEFDDLQVLVSEALRILKPGGLLILETPNPENISVATIGFYTDPTHKRPLPPALLSFVAEYQGFSRVKIARLQESSTLKDSSTIEFSDVIAGVSPDFAIIAQKSASSDILTLFDQPFAKEYGLTYCELAVRFQKAIHGIEARLEQAEIKAGIMAAELNTLYKMRSWRSTAPLLSIIHAVRQVKVKGAQIVKSMLKPVVAVMIGFALKHPMLKAHAGNWVRRYPRLEARLRQFSVDNGLLQLSSMHRLPSSDFFPLVMEFSQLTPAARRIYYDLKAAAGKKQREKS